MGRIAILPPEVANKIAAGEVITRPASVVKELVENAVDAGADRILLEIEEGGCRRIRIIDNGWGMDPEEAPLSLRRHATSKIRQDQDLLHLQTLGFRGEALPSIAAVSRLELCSRPAELPLGSRLYVEGGQLVAQEPWFGPAGTQVVVEDLFFNTPARRKFLRSRTAEQAQIVELVRQLALGYPKLTFQLRSGGKILLDAPGPVSLAERLATLLPFDWIEQLLPVTAGYGDFRIEGLISRPDHQAATPRYQYFLVNRRLVSDRLLSGAVREAYQDLLPRGRHPVVVLHLEVPPDQVDVNVHPAKAEVRFRDSSRIFAGLLTALRQALTGGCGPALGAQLPAWQPTSPRVTEPLPVALFQQPSSAPTSDLTFVSQGEVPEPPPTASATPWRFSELTILGQLHATYILAQAPEGLILLDQHAAHERLLFEALRQQPEGPAPRQGLLLPQAVELTPEQAAWVEEHLEELDRAGLELEPFGGSTFLVRTVPAGLTCQEPGQMAQELIAELAQLGPPPDPASFRHRLHLTLACRGAIKAGQTLTLVEMQKLLAALDTLPAASHCPHGRPLWRLLTLGEIHRHFRRPRR